MSDDLHIAVLVDCTLSPLDHLRKDVAGLRVLGVLLSQGLDLLLKLLRFLAQLLIHDFLHLLCKVVLSALGGCAPTLSPNLAQTRAISFLS